MIIGGLLCETYRPNADEYTILRGKAVLTLEPVAPGFKLRVADIFSG